MPGQPAPDLSPLQPQRQAPQGRLHAVSEEPVWEPSSNLLTPKERTILVLAANGETNAAIGRQMNPRMGTSNIHMRLCVIYGKLGARNKTHAVALAMKAELINPAKIHEDRF